MHACVRNEYVRTTKMSFI